MPVPFMADNPFVAMVNVHERLVFRIIPATMKMLVRVHTVTVTTFSILTGIRKQYF